MKALILTIGDEILIGNTLNTNANWIAKNLTLIGIDVEKMLTVGDTQDAIKQGLKIGLNAADVLLITGGLGPTHDDITKVAVASYFEKSLLFDTDVLANLEKKLAKRGRKLTQSNHAIAYVPEGFEVIENPVGTAPCLWYNYTDGKSEKYIVMMPGVPYEMKAIMNSSVLPRLQSLNGISIQHVYVRTAGIPESYLAEKIGDTNSFLEEGISLAFLPNPKTGVTLRITGKGTNKEEISHLLEKARAHIQSQIENYIVGFGDVTLEQKIATYLTSKMKTLATAESCTGGHIADRITDNPGSSAYFMGSIIAYDNEVKEEVLGVDGDTLEQFGAVSEEVAKQMAVGVRMLMKTDYGIATTGIAGPSGGTEEKPVGTVWISIASSEGVKAKQLHLTENRMLNKELTSSYALFMLFQLVK